MKSIYIPSGESRSYEYLVTDHLVVDGHLNVVNGVKAKNISGHGVITAGTVYGDTITADEIETTTIVCKRLMAKRISAAEVFASDSAAVSCFLSAAYVETGRLTTALCEIDGVKADEVVHLRPKKRGMVLTLLLSAVRSLWLSLTTPIEDAEYVPVEGNSDDGKGADPEQTEDDAMREKIARTVREIMEKKHEKTGDNAVEDFELQRLIGTFKLLRNQGYTLRIIPGTPEENAPVYDFEKDEIIRTAA